MAYRCLLQAWDGRISPFALCLLLKLLRAYNNAILDDPPALIDKFVAYQSIRKIVQYGIEAAAYDLGLPQRDLACPASSVACTSPSYPVNAAYSVEAVVDQWQCPQVYNMSRLIL